MRANKRTSTTTRSRVSRSKSSTSSLHRSTSSSLSSISTSRPSSTSSRVTAAAAASSSQGFSRGVTAAGAPSRKVSGTATRRAITTISVTPGALPQFTRAQEASLKRIRSAGAGATSTNGSIAAPVNVSMKGFAHSQFVSDSIAPEAYAFATEPIKFSIKVQKTDKVYPVVGYEGETIMDAAVRHKVPLRFTCGTTGEQESQNGLGPSCGNCFGIFPRGYHDALQPPDSDEETQMFLVQRSRFGHFTPGFRFLCVTELIPDYEGVQIYIPNDPTPEFQSH